MVCVLVPRLLKQNVGYYLESSEVLTVMPPFLAWYGSAIILWVLYICMLSLYFCKDKINFK
jgi:hypothetical protein